MENFTCISRALSDPTRVRLVELLQRKSYCVCALAKMLEITQPAVSQHLKVLKEAGLIVPDKKGYWVHYTVNYSIVEAYQKKLRRLFGMGGGEEKCVKRKKSVNIRKN
jgi:DNA-binding transcriptional ArsR family regulator